MKMNVHHQKQTFFLTFLLAGLLCAVVGCGPEDLNPSSSSSGSEKKSGNGSFSSDELTIKSESQYRKIEDGIGNLVYSTEVLDKGKEDTYNLQEEFTGPTKAIHMRAYFPGTLRSLMSEGKIWNELKDKKTYHAQITISTPGLSANERKIVTKYPYSEKLADWDQQRLVIADDDTSDFNKSEDERYLDLDEEIRKLAKAEGEKLPFTGEVCVQLYFKIANRKEKVYDDAQESVKIRKVKLKRPIAEGCFKYTVKK